MPACEPNQWTLIASGVEQGRVQRVNLVGLWIVGKTGDPPPDSQTSPASEPYQAMLNDEFPAVQSRDWTDLDIYGRPTGDSAALYLFSEVL